MGALHGVKWETRKKYSIEWVDNDASTRPTNQRRVTFDFLAPKVDYFIPLPVTTW